MLSAHSTLMLQAPGLVKAAEADWA